LDFLNGNPIINLWSYNTTWIEDADSTNFVMLSYCLNNKAIKSEIIQNWLKFQTSAFVPTRTFVLENPALTVFVLLYY
jgi:hypothetical protein